MYQDGILKYQLLSIVICKEWVVNDNNLVYKSFYTQYLSNIVPKHKNIYTSIKKRGFPKLKGYDDLPKSPVALI